MGQAAQLIGAAAVPLRLSIKNLAAPRAAGVFAVGLWAAVAAVAQTSLAVVSPESSAALFKELDAAFIAQHKKSTGRDVRIEPKAGLPKAPSPAGAGGLAADVVVLEHPGAIDQLAAAGSVAADWRQRFPFESAPWTSTVLLAVREGNPKRIKDWSDLARSGLRIVMADPAVDASGRSAWLAAWGATLQGGGNEAKATRLGAGLIRNATPFAPNAEAAIDSFAGQGVGDLLLALESDASAIQRSAEAAGTKRNPELVYPRRSLALPQPVAVIEPTTRKKGTGELAKAYVNFMFSDAGQEIAAAHGMRPQSTDVLKRHAAQFKPIQLFSSDEVFGDASKAEPTHFAAGGWFDRLQRARGK